MNWDLYDSTSLPLHYIISKFFIFSKNENIINFFGLYFRLLIFFFYLTLLKKLKIKNLINWNLVFLSSTLLLSPYFRTSAFLGLVKNIGIISLITIYFYYCFGENKNFKYFLTILLPQ